MTILWRTKALVATGHRMHVGFALGSSGGNIQPGSEVNIYYQRSLASSACAVMASTLETGKIRRSKGG